MIASVVPPGKNGARRRGWRRRDRRGTPRRALGARQVETRAVLEHLRAVAHHEPLDEGTLAFGHRAGEFERPAAGFVRFGHGLGVHGGIDVRSQREGQAPVAHRAGGIEPHVFLERARGPEAV